MVPPTRRSEPTVQIETVPDGKSEVKPEFSRRTHRLNNAEEKRFSNENIDTQCDQD